MVEAWSALLDKKIAVIPDDLIVRLLDDIHLGVRRAAMHFLMVMVGRRPAYADFAFLQLCRRVNDIDIENRILATRLLGDLHTGSLETLKLAIDKQSGKEEEWCPAGAFVIALEDQFKAVRTAAIESICRLSIASAAFAGASKHLIIDAFNDEDEEVRLLTVQGLLKICQRHNLTFELDHLESALCLLDDGQAALRQAVRHVLTWFDIPDGESLLKTLRCLNVALIKYPGEVLEASRCVASLGKKHSELVRNCLVQLLKLDKFFMIPEPKIEDVYYQLKAVLIYNAVGEDAELAADLPEFMLRHHCYFRLKFRDLVPTIRSSPASSSFYRNICE